MPILVVIDRLLHEEQVGDTICQHVFILAERARVGAG